MPHPVSRAQRSCVALLAVASVIGAFDAQALGHGMFPRNVPVDRIVANLKRSIEANPSDAEALYRLGRVHTLALETKTEFVLAFESGRTPDDATPTEGSWSRRKPYGDNEKAPASTPAQIREHLSEAIRCLNRAIELRPESGAYRLTLACALEAGKPLLGEVDSWPLCPVAGVGAGSANDRSGGLEYPRGLLLAARNSDTEFDRLMRTFRENDRQDGTRGVLATLAFRMRSDPATDAATKEFLERFRAADWVDLIEDQYFTAMCYSLPTNGRADAQPMWGGRQDWTSYEAAGNFVRVVEARAARPDDSIRLKVAKATLKAFDELPPPRGITPLVIDRAGRPYSAIPIEKRVAFDLDGSGRPIRWSWVAPDVGILAWDPDRTGQIRSGRQLFGSVSWWLFFDSGYEALATLDDDGDGALRGSELDGIVVWFDRDSDGVSDEGEVVAVQSLGIEWLSCRADRNEGEVPRSAAGVRLDDGRVLPTYDWIPTASELVIEEAHRRR